MSLADSHLTYIGAQSRAWGDVARYDVYRREGGLQLGWVMLCRNGRWVATSDDPLTDNGPSYRTRWEAATALWGRS